MAKHPWVETNGKIRWGVQLIVPDRRDALTDLMRTGKMVEQLGYDALFIFDHPAIHVDPWIALSGLAVATDTIRLGSAVNCVSYRHPGHLARLGADFDNLSRGRLIFGIGSGWWEDEYRALDVPFRPLPERQASLDEALRIIQGVWQGEPFTYSGAHFRTDALHVSPPPVQQPRPPILIGGSGEKRTLGQVARFADACNVRDGESLSDASVPDSQRAAVVRKKLDALKARCDEVSRPYEDVLRTHFTLYAILAPTEAEVARKRAAMDPSRSTSPGTRRDGGASVLAATPERAVAFYRAMAAVGIQYFVVQLDGTDLETIELLANEVAPHVQLAAG